MKKMILMVMIAYGSVGAAFANDVFPNDCNDGGVYRALGGPNVEMNSGGEKSLVVGANDLVDCKNGNTTTCAGTAYNNYTCVLHFSGLVGTEARAFYDNFNVPKQPNGEKILTISLDGMTRDGSMRSTVLVCTPRECAYRQVFDPIE